nr:hypothetical protein [Arsenicicoccus piscis]
MRAWSRVIDPRPVTEIQVSLLDTATLIRGSASISWACSELREMKNQRSPSSSTCWIDIGRDCSPWSGERTVIIANRSSRSSSTTLAGSPAGCSTSGRSVPSRPSLLRLRSCSLRLIRTPPCRR